MHLDKVLDFLAYHIHSADDHYVRWKWAVGSVAMWDNRYLHTSGLFGRYILLSLAQVYSPSSLPWYLQGTETRYQNNRFRRAT
jgi:alpha-ketoglutarate-dependent taurine dioxygenase